MMIKDKLFILVFCLTTFGCAQLTGKSANNELALQMTEVNTKLTLLQEKMDKLDKKVNTLDKQQQKMMIEIQNTQSLIQSVL